MKTLWKRFTSTTPSFWRKLRNISGILTAAAIGGTQLPMGEFGLMIMEHAATTGFILALVCQFAAPDQKDGN